MFFGTSAVALSRSSHQLLNCLLTLPRLFSSLKQWSRNCRAFYQATSSKPIFKDVASFGMKIKGRRRKLDNGVACMRVLDENCFIIFHQQILHFGKCWSVILLFQDMAKSYLQLQNTYGNKMRNKILSFWNVQTDFSMVQWELSVTGEPLIVEQSEAEERKRCTN